MAVEAEWGEWELGEFHSHSIGGHSYCLHPVALVDHKRKAEKAFIATAKCQVVHMHASDARCEGGCLVYGVMCPKMHKHSDNGQEALPL